MRLQYYFLVAESSNRCWQKICSIMEKVSLGMYMCSGEKPKIITQSLFMFLEGEDEKEKYRLLEMVDDGRIHAKDLNKQKRLKSSQKKVRLK